MGYAINNVATGDTWTAAATVQAQTPCMRLNIDVLNAAVYVQLATGSGGGLTWGEEVFVPPSFRSLERKFIAARARSAVAGVPARVTISALTDIDING